MVQSLFQYWWLFLFHTYEFGVSPAAQLTESGLAGYILSWLQNDRGSLDRPYSSVTPRQKPAAHSMEENQIETHRAHLVLSHWSASSFIIIESILPCCLSLLQIHQSASTERQIVMSLQQHLQQVNTHQHRLAEH